MKGRFKDTFTRQHDQSDCGVACLASVIRFYDGFQSLERLRALSGTTGQGTTMLGLYQAANQLGFETEAFKAQSIDSLKQIQAPAILHVVVNNTLQHFFVFYGLKDEVVTIGDPAMGVREISTQELDELWKSKGLLMLKPTDKFINQAEWRGNRMTWIKGLIQDDAAFLAISIFLGILLSILGLTTAIFSQKLIDSILPSGNSRALIISLALVFLLLLIKSGLSYLRALFMIIQAKRFNTRIIQNFYDHLLNLPKAFFDTRKTGDLIARLNDTRRIQTVLGFISANLIVDALMVIASLGFVFTYSWIVALILFVSIPSYGLLVYFLKDRVSFANKEAMSGYAFTEGHYVDTIQGVTAIKAAGREGFFSEINQQVYGIFQQKVFQLGKLNIRFGLLSELIGVVVLMAVFSTSAWLVLTDSLEIGEMVALLTLSGGAVPAISRLSIANFPIQEALIAFDRMFEFTALEKAPSDQPANEFANLSAYDVRLRDVTFRFPGRKPILQNVNMDVSEGEIVALLGESGGGKSTLVQILQKFYGPESGVITVGGRNLSDIPSVEWKKVLGVVPQEIKIFNGSLLFNIAMSDKPEDMQHVINESMRLGFHQFFSAFPQNYLTLLGEEGINISGGQRQLVGIMRALLWSPKILILDEATAAMDKNTERFILDLLGKLKREMSIVMITHRIKAAQIADRIYILEHGSLTHGVSPSELMLSINFFSEGVNEIARAR